MSSTSKVFQRSVSNSSLINCSTAVVVRRLSLEQIRSNMYFEIQIVTVQEPINGNSTKQFRAIFKLDGMTYNDVDVDPTQAKMKAMRCLLKNIFLLFMNTNDFNTIYPISCAIYKYKSGLMYVVDQLHSNLYRVQVEINDLLYYSESACAASGRIDVLAAILINNHVPPGRIPNENGCETRNLKIMLDSIHKQLSYDLKITPLLSYPSVYNIYMMIDGKLFNEMGNSEEQAKIKIVKKILNEIQEYQSNIGLTSNQPMSSLIYAFKENFIVQKTLSEEGDSFITKMDGHIFKEPKSTYTEARLNIIVKIIADVTDDLILVERRKLIKQSCKSIPEMEPIVLLEKLIPNIKIQNTSSDVNCQFKTLIRINDMVYHGIGSKIKTANEAAAKSALGTLFNISYSPMRVIDHIKKSSLKEFELSQPYADAIQSLILQKYLEVTNAGSRMGYFDLNTVLAGIVMTRSSEINSGTVICVTTGTRTINGKNLCLNGSVVNDMHAEILAKRCLIDFFYRQLDLLKNGATANESIFVKTDNHIDKKMMFKIKKEVAFHLYISKTPCGDASCHKSDDYETVGYLRTKVEASQGSISIQKRTSNIQTWDGIKNGEQLVTMSCCDKILKWNLLGIQGSLLANVLDPIYLKSITFGSTFPAKLMYRALCNRLPNTHHTYAAPYHLNTPKLACTTTLEIRNPNFAKGKTPDDCLIWTIGWNSYENILYDTGKTTKTPQNNGIPPRIAKRIFFENFHKIIVPILLKDIDGTLDYGQCKQLAVDYQAVKKIFYDTLIERNIGNWIKKPNEQDEFRL